VAATVSPARRRLRRRERGLAYLLLIPSLLIFGVFVFWPLVHNVYLGFYRNPPFPGLPSTYVGFDQYRDVLTSQDFFDSVKTTFLVADAGALHVFDPTTGSRIGT